MKTAILNILLPTLLLAPSAAARAYNNVYRADNTTSTSSSASPGVPTPPPAGMSCKGGLDYPCQDLCFCQGSGSTVSCHYDPTSRCVQMCTC